MCVVAWLEMLRELCASSGLVSVFVQIRRMWYWFADVSQGLPKEWQRTLQANGITEQEQKKNPQAIIDVVTFFNEHNDKRSDDSLYHKFDNARLHDSPQSA